MATECRHSCQPTSARRRARRPIRNTTPPKTIRSAASSIGMKAGPGRCSVPKGKAWLSSMATRPTRIRARPATRSIVIAERVPPPGSLDLADLLHHLSQPGRVLGPPRVELVGVHVRDGRLELGVRGDDLKLLHRLPGGIAEDLDHARRRVLRHDQSGPRGVLDVVALRLER